MPKYTKLLTIQERSECMKFGAAIKLAEYGATPAQFLKQAAGLGTLMAVPAGASKAVVALALLSGIPLGIAAHIVGKKITEEQNNEKELKEQIKYYKGTTGALESGLAAAAPVNPADDSRSEM